MTAPSKTMLAPLALPILSAKAAMRGLALSLVVLASSTAMAAPNGQTFYDCVAQVQSQYQLDLSKCLFYLADQRAVCNAQAVQRYADGMTGCAVTASKASAIRTQVTPLAKQNIDPAFTRRLR
jgi:hypothetical protein